MTPMKAIRAKCIDCMCGNRAEVRRCPCENCALYPYRMGHRPKQGSYTPEGPDNENTLSSPTVECSEGQQNKNPARTGRKDDKQ